MNSFLSNIEYEDFVIVCTNVYNEDFFQKAVNAFEKLSAEKMIKGSFYDNRWLLYDGIDWTGINFTLNDKLYSNHIGRILGISKTTIDRMLRCYALNCRGALIYDTIALSHINTIKDFLQKCGDIGLKYYKDGINAIESFLWFIGTPDDIITNLTQDIIVKKRKYKNQRELKPVINYLVIEDALRNLYSSDIEDDEFVKYFPLYFWVYVTFTLPLRATEMLVTPYNCVENINGESYLKVRRTTLKGKSKKVHYDVDTDYEIFRYKIDNSELVSNITKYQELTNDSSRRFLLTRDKEYDLDIYPLCTFNNLISRFMDKYIIPNPKYNYVKYACGIENFQYVTAGDSRPIAMATLYFSGASADVCRQLANHTSINTSAGYYTNISEIIMGSSVMRLVKRVNNMQNNALQCLANDSCELSVTNTSLCLSKKRMKDLNNIEDCEEQGHCEECIGCKYYRPTREELNSYLNENKEKVDWAAKLLTDYLNDALKLKDYDLTLDELLLKVQRDGSRFKTGADIDAKEKYKEWEKSKNTQKTNY